MTEADWFALVVQDDEDRVATIRAHFETDEDTGVCELHVSVDERTMPNIRVYAGKTDDPIAVRYKGEWLI